ITVIRLITVTPAVKSRSTMRPLDTVGGTVSLGTKMPSTSPAITNSSWLRPTRSWRWRRVNRVPGRTGSLRGPDGLACTTLPPRRANSACRSNDPRPSPPRHHPPRRVPGGCSVRSDQSQLLGAPYRFTPAGRPELPENALEVSLDGVDG